MKTEVITTMIALVFFVHFATTISPNTQPSWLFSLLSLSLAVAAVTVPFMVTTTRHTRRIVGAAAIIPGPRGWPLARRRPDGEVRGGGHESLAPESLPREHGGQRVGLEGAAVSEELGEMVREGYELVGTFNLGDHYYKTPWGLLVDLWGLGPLCGGLAARVRGYFGKIIEERRVAGDCHDRDDLLSYMFSLPEEEKLEDSDVIAVLWAGLYMEVQLRNPNFLEIINNFLTMPFVLKVKLFLHDGHYACKEMIFRGVDVVAILLEWAMARMSLHPDIQSKAHEEMDAAVGLRRPVTDSDVPNLPLLQWILKETLRMHPPGPLLSWARLAVQDAQVGKHVVPAGTTAMVNVWAISHDEAIWGDPWVFRPERFNADRSPRRSDFVVTPVTLFAAEFGLKVIPLLLLMSDIIIKDLHDRELKVTLWGQRGKAFSVENLYDEADPRAIVTLFVGCVPKEYQKVVHVTANNACHWYFNPPIAEAQPFYTRFQGQRFSIDIPAPPVEESPDTQETIVIEHKTLQELNEIDPYDFPATTAASDPLGTPLSVEQLLNTTLPAQDKPDDTAGHCDPADPSRSPPQDKTKAVKRKLFDDQSTAEQDGEESAELPEDIPQGSTAVADMDKEKSKRNTHSQETSDYQPKRPKYQ
ncbi:unnamed protein product [Miscanthus lutarioriparius]|uniref:Uncharacterized protein n=1 Tax=Miscanthus lutarioriparius TaxID=422564 RepID=A0A811Q8V8_9POAL|nr:unnamed protein product [Miscanthus lutarioriparius]